MFIGHFSGLFVLLLNSSHVLYKEKKTCFTGKSLPLVGIFCFSSYFRSTHNDFSCNMYYTSLFSSLFLDLPIISLSVYLTITLKKFC